jgi:DNA-binding transcriptional ArsR family regulator
VKPEQPAKGFDVFQDAEVMKVVGHPLRMRAFTEAVKGPVSAKDLSQRFDEPLPKMSYHVRLLADAGLLKPVKRTRRRGAIETHYRAIATLEVDDAVLDGAPPDVLASYFATQMRLISEDALHALESGAADERDVFLGRMHLVVDAAGRERVAAELNAFYARMAELEAELRKEPGEDTSEVNLAFVYYTGERISGRNGPMMLSYESDHLETIPP